MSDRFNQLTPAQDEVLSILAEECAEVIQAVCKIKRHGLKCGHPEMGDWDNQTQLIKEVGDVVAAVTLLHAMLAVAPGYLDLVIHEKFKELRKWTHHIDWEKLDG